MGSMEVISGSYIQIHTTTYNDTFKRYAIELYLYVDINIGNISKERGHI